MRSIEISTEVFAKIWSQRIAGEESENVILTRLLGLKAAVHSEKNLNEKSSLKSKFITAALWRQDVREGLRQLGGAGHLKEIYEVVRAIRREHGRSVPANLEAIIRRELEYNSSDASTYQGKRDWFRSVNGIGSGNWALREDTEK